MFDMFEWSNILHHFHFLRPWWLLALIPFLGLFYIKWRAEANVSAWQKELPDHLRQALTVGEKGFKRLLPLTMLFLMVFLAVLVCAGPTWKKEASPFNQDKTPLVIVLDTSIAMKEQDIAPDRLTRAKHKIADLLSLRSGGQNALIAYSGSAHLVMPLTEDSSVFKPMLEALDPDVMPVTGQDSQKAIALVQTQLASQANAGTVLIITNDVDSQSTLAWKGFFTNKEASNKEATDKNIGASTQLIILAAGNSNAPSDIPLRLDSLQQLASNANGSVVTLSVDDQDIETIVRRVENHALLNVDNDQPWQDMGYYLLLPIMILLLLWFRRGWTVQWSGLFSRSSIKNSSLKNLAIVTLLNGMILLSGFAYTPNNAYAKPVHSYAEPSNNSENIEVANLSFSEKISQFWLDLWMTRDQQGQWYFNKGEYLKAAEHYESSLHKGIAYYYASQFSASYKTLNQHQELDYQIHAVSALARQREYVKTEALLTKLLKQQGDNLDPEIKKILQNNLEITSKVIKEIDQFSESQSTGMEAADSVSKELGDEPQTSKGVDTEVTEQQLLQETLTAEQLLADDATVDKWFDRVESDPKTFLRAKFAIQSQQQNQNQMGAQSLNDESNGESDE